jgi:tight adherence protein B
MAPLAFFGLVLLLTFATVLYCLKPSQVETALKRELVNITRAPQARASGLTILRPAGSHSVPWIDAFVRRLPGSSALAIIIKQAGRNWQTSSIILVSLLLAMLGGLVTFLILPIPLAVAAVAIGLGGVPSFYIYLLRESRFKRSEALLPDAIDLLSRALRAGLSLPTALETVGQEIADPLGSEFRMLREEQKLGLPLRDAIMNLVERMPIDDVRFLATAMLVQMETGGNLTLILDKTGAVMRERVRLRGQLRIYTAQGRLSGWILCAMPFLLFLLIAMVNPDYEKLLVNDPFGQRLIHLGLVMMVAGILIIRRIINIKI